MIHALRSAGERRTRSTEQRGLEPKLRLVPEDDETGSAVAPDGPQPGESGPSPESALAQLGLGIGLTVVLHAFGQALWYAFWRAVWPHEAAEPSRLARVFAWMPVTQLPYLYVGGADGKLVTGQYVDADKEYLVKFLNTIGAAVGCTNSANAGPLDDFNHDNNNYRSKNYTYNYYLTPQPPEPADNKPPITGRLPALIVA